MTLGEKIKKARKDKKITQAKLCENKITRNMLSAIERNKALPSLDTVKFIAKQLSLPVSYLISDDEDLFFYEKKDIMKSIKTSYKEKNYRRCIEYISKLSNADDEISLILAHSHFELGRRAVLNGSLKSGKFHLDAAMESCADTVYDTSRIENLMLMYTALISNIQAPLLEFDAKLFAKNVDVGFDYEFYKYLIQDTSYEHKNPIFSKHVKAKNLIKARKYKDALILLCEIEKEKTAETYNAYVIFVVYTDIENCYKQLADFENAYRYASKRISLIEGFKT